MELITGETVAREQAFRKSLLFYWLCLRSHVTEYVAISFGIPSRIISSPEGTNYASARIALGQFDRRILAD